MAWTDPRTWVTGEVVTASQMNTHIRDNMNALGPALGAYQRGTTDLEAWYPCGARTGADLVGGSFSTDLLYVVPFFPIRGATIDRIGVSVSTTGDLDARAGLYAPKSQTNIYPGSLLAEGGPWTTGSTGMASTTISAAVGSNFILWAAVVVGTGSTGTFHCIPTGNNPSAVFPAVGWPSTGGATGGNYLSTAHTFAALPATYPASAVRTSGRPPAVFIRYA
jgi:hypothetical protein